MKLLFILIFLILSVPCYSEEQPGTYQLFMGRIVHTGALPTSNTYTNEYLFKINTKTGEVWIAAEGEQNSKKDEKNTAQIYRKWDKFEYEYNLENFTITK